MKLNRVKNLILRTNINDWVKYDNGDYYFRDDDYSIDLERSYVDYNGTFVVSISLWKNGKFIRECYFREELHDFVKKIDSHLKGEYHEKK